MKNILLTGPLLSNSGYGVHSRQVFSFLKTLKNVKIYCNVLNWGNMPWHISNEYTSNLYEEIIEKFIPESMISNISFEESYTVGYPHEWLYFGTKKNIGITAGVETDLVPLYWLNYINKIDKVICTSNFTAQAFYNTAKAHDFILNKKLNINYQFFYEEFESEEVTNLKILNNINTKNNLLLIGQLTSTDNELDRKNIFNSIESLTRILSNVEDSGLIIKTNLGNNSYLDFDRLKSHFKKYKDRLYNELGEKMPNIYIVHGNMKPKELKTLYNSEKVSALVSLSRGEGFGLTLLEAASCGLPIIATDYSAYKEFLDDNFVQVDYELENIPNEKIDNKIYVKNSKWANYINKSLHMNILKFFNNEDLYNKISKDLQKNIVNNFNKESILKKYRLCLN